MDIKIHKEEKIPHSLPQGLSDDIMALQGHYIGMLKFMREHSDIVYHP